MSAISVAPLDPYEPKKFGGKKFDRKKVQLFGNSNFFCSNLFLDPGKVKKLQTLLGGGTSDAPLTQ